MPNGPSYPGEYFFIKWFGICWTEETVFQVSLSLFSCYFVSLLHTISLPVGVVKVIAGNFGLTSLHSICCQVKPSARCNSTVSKNSLLSYANNANVNVITKGIVFLLANIYVGTSGRNRTPVFGFGDRCVTISTTLIYYIKQINLFALYNF